MKKRIITLLAMMLCLVGGVFAQTNVNGTVISQEDGEPIVGASILVVGTDIGTATDLNGKFSLTVPAGSSKLRVSYVGMETLEVDAQPSMNIELKTEILDEVIVVAYGTAKKSAFTGSAATVNSDEISKKITTNVADALVGTVSGLQLRGSSGAPGSDNGKLNIRGIASLYADTDPLIIVDGAPYSGSLSNIPPSDIKSVSVLKDAASAALYGARGAAGVIIITTKKGETADAVINVDVKVGANSRSVPDYDVFTSAGEYYEAYYKQLYNYSFYSQGNTPAAAHAWANQEMLSQLAYNVYTVPNGEYLIGTDGKINPNATLGRSYVYTDPATTEKTGYYLTPDNWTDAAYRNAMRQEYTVSASAGNDKSSFYMSASYLNEEGIIKPSGYERFTSRLKADYQAKKWLKLGANIGYVRSTTESAPNYDEEQLGSTNVMYYSSYIAPIYPLYVRGIALDDNGNPTGDPYIRTDEFGNQQYDYGVPASNYQGINSRTFLATGNPIGANYQNEVYNIGNMFSGVYTVDVTILPQLKFNSTNTLNLGQNSFSDYENPFYGPKVGVNGQIIKYQTNTFRQNYTQTLNYNQQFGLSEISAILGHEWYKTTTRYLYAERTGGFSPEIPELNAFAKMSGSNSYTTAYNVEGFFGTAQYSYDEKYFLSGSYRRDATSRFHKDNRWGDFWSVGGAWLLSKESFAKDLGLNWDDQIKLKASIGQQGNDGIGNWAYIDTYTLVKASDTSMSPTFSRTGNKDITWETTTNLNVGLEFAFFKSRLTGSIDFYNKKTTDLLFWLSIPESMGARGYYGNLGDISNTGYEVTLGGDVIRNKNLKWNITANIAHNQTKILKLPEAKITENGGFAESGANIQLWYEEGGSLYTPFLRKYAGVNANGEALYWVDEDLINANGAAITSRPGQKESYTTTDYSKASRYKFESLLPKFNGGFSTSLDFYGFDMSASFEYQIGGTVYDYHYQGLMGPVSSTPDGKNFHKDVLKSWSPNNTSSDIPRFQYNDQYTNSQSDRWLTDASYLAFQSFTVGYTVPRSLTSKIKLDNMRFYVTGENLALWSARKGLDPRYSFEGSAYVNVYSPARNISGGLHLTF